MIRHSLSATLAAAMMAAVGQPASAAVLTFDDLSGLSFFTSDYMGFRFGNNDSATNPFFHTQQVSPFYTPRSPLTYVATDFSLYDNTNPYQATLPISSAAAFIFNGAYFSGSDTIGYQLLLGGITVYTSAPSATLTSTPTFVASGYTGLVNQVVIFGRQGFYAFDDFTYNVAPPAPVPEPATWAMMIVGFGAVGAAMRRRKVAVSFA